MFEAVGMVLLAGSALALLFAEVAGWVSLATVGWVLFVGCCAFFFADKMGWLSDDPMKPLGKRRPKAEDAPVIPLPSDSRPLLDRQADALFAHLRTSTEPRLSIAARTWAIAAGCGRRRGDEVLDHLGATGRLVRQGGLRSQWVIRPV